MNASHLAAKQAGPFFPFSFSPPPPLVPGPSEKYAAKGGTGICRRTLSIFTGERMASGNHSGFSATLVTLARQFVLHLNIFVDVDKSLDERVQHGQDECNLHTVGKCGVLLLEELVWVVLPFACVPSVCVDRYQVSCNPSYMYEHLHSHESMLALRPVMIPWCGSVPASS